MQTSELFDADYFARFHSFLEQTGIDSTFDCNRIDEDDTNQPSAQPSTDIITPDDIAFVRVKALPNIYFGLSYKTKRNTGDQRYT
mmetsp:Transcript_13034/g.19901  ORF Transcript_13034/g.19901 Transcript_13034/m.19901 type:complete len:85 (+) Transcript_13034:1156-1410(+)